MKAILDTKIKVTEIKNPLCADSIEERSIVHCGQSIVEIVDTDCEIAVSMNGEAIERSVWATTFPNKGDHLVVVPIIQDSETLALVALVALVIFAPHIAVAVGGSAAGTVGALTTYGLVLTAATTIGGGMLINSIAGVGAANDRISGASPSDSYGWNPQTAQRQGLPIARAYGKNFIHGNVIAVYSEPSGTDGVDEVMNILIGLGLGPVKGITKSNGVDYDIFINDQIASNYQGILTEEKLGELEQSSISYFTSTKPEYRPQWIVENGDPRLYVTPDLDFDELEIQLNFPRGIYNGTGSSLSGHSVGIKIEISEHDADSWSTLVADSVSSDSARAIRKSYITSGTYTGGSSVTINNGTQYDIRVTKTTADKDDIRWGDDLSFFAVREVINDSFQYPRTALLGISALASRQLSGGLNVACIQEGAIVGTYNGSMWTLEYSNNPAWVLWDILTQPVISGDGDGTPYAIERYDGINPSRLDLSKFYELALFCDQSDIPDGEGGVEKRITFNGVFDTEINMWDAAQKVCEIARCSLVWVGVKLTLAIDKADDWVQLFSVANTHRDSFKQTYLPQAERASEIEVHYKDADRYFERTPFTIINDNIGNLSNKVVLELFGITKQSEAYRAAVLKLAQTELLKSIAEFDANAESITAKIGDVIALQADVPQWGSSGRVVSAATGYIVTNKDQEYEAGVTYDLLIRFGDPGVGATEDLVETKTVANGHDAITGGSQGSKEFEVAADKSAHYKDSDTIVVVGSTGNDETYTLDGDSVFGTVTTITVNETIASAVFDGGLYNARRIVPTVAFSVAPAAKDIYVFGVENLATRLYRLKSIRRSTDQNATLTAIEYDPSIYGLDDNQPVVTQPGYFSPQTSPDAYVPPVMDEIMQLLPQSIYEASVPDIDIPQYSNLAVTDNSPGAGSVAWSADVGGSPITVTYRGVAYEITPGNTSSLFIYWKPSATTVFSSTNLMSTVISDAGWLMIINTSGSGQLTFQSPAIHGGVIQAGTITASGAQIADATIVNAKIAALAVTSAKIGTLEVKSANIENLTVGTGKITDDAVSNSAEDYTAGSFSADSGWNIAESVSITPSGNKVKATGRFNLSGTAGATYSVRLRRGSTDIIDTGAVNFSADTADVISIELSWMDLSPGTSNVTYSVEFERPFGATWTISERRILVEDIKK